jgi:hypothetical protein
MKRPPVWFADTSVFTNLLDVPGRAQRREQVLREQRDRETQRCGLVLPVATVIETGNHIAQLANGSERRAAAQRFGDILLLVAAGRAPWRLHSASWDSAFLHRLVRAGSTGATLVDHAMRELGCGDLSILVEREVYRDQTGISDVRIWTLDAGLAAHS